jgi:aminoglycoside phosphotransferase (APT) family kinase protein
VTDTSFKHAMAAWLSSRIPGSEELSIGELEAPSGSGNSAETSFIEVRYRADGKRHERKLVLRRQNQGSDLFMDATLQLPHRMMTALARHPAVPVPKVLGIELDSLVLDRPFLVMDAIEGRGVSLSPPYNASGWLVEMDPKDRGALWRNGIEAMAAVHKLPWEPDFSFLHDRTSSAAAGLDQYIEWVRQWYLWARRDRVQPIADAALDYLIANRPLLTPTGVLWGDSQPSNMLFAGDGRVSAVLDWEMASLGPGEVDLAWWLFFDEFYSSGFGLPRLEGLPSREESIAIWEAAVGREVRALEYYELLARFRMNIISIRASDRLVNAGRLAPDVDVFTHNPITKMMARQLGLPIPEPGTGFAALLKALDVNPERDTTSA